MKRPDVEIKGWVLYDGACGFCSRWVRLWEPALAKRGFLIAPLQSDWVAGKLHLSDKELASDFRLLLADGEQLAGAAAYRYLMRRIGWATPFYLLSILPVFRTLFDFGYRLFADSRFRISRRCHLPGPGQAQLTRDGMNSPARRS